MGAPLKVLMVEDSENDSELLVHELRRGGFDPAWKRVETEDAMRAALEEDDWDIVTSDYDMPRFSAPKALAVLKESGRDVPFIVVSGVISMERAVELMKAGAHDFVEKNDLARLVPAVERGLRLVEEHRGRKRAEAHIKHLALHDSLTDLPNRFLFHDRLQNAVAQLERTGGVLALLFLDLDDFKDVNDTLGHAAGDELLKAVAERLKSYLRGSDTVGRHNTILARLGGDEFTILLTNLADPVGAATVADRIIEDLSRPFTVGGDVIHTGACIGIAVYPTHGDKPEELLKKADLALYRAKAEGRNRYHFYSEEMETEIRARKDLERDLRTALAEGQLSLVYQPQMDIKSGSLAGMETLLRWNHPERGAISPAEFVPVAEAMGLIVPIGEWVLRQACAQNKAWQDAGLPAFAVAVNLSAVQIRQDNLVATVDDALQQAGLDPAYLHIEITESVFMQDGAREMLLDFRRSGIDISLDDFGTGYSSLSYLTRFPVDKIKLDRSFVRDIAHDTSNAAIIKAVVNLGHSLGMRVNVEGVETQNEVVILRSFGADEIQGYYYSRPLPADAVPEFVAETIASSEQATRRA